jgi:hypothetical protein
MLLRQAVLRCCYCCNAYLISGVVVMHGALQGIRQLAQRLTAVTMCVCYTVRNALDGYYYCRPDDTEADTQLKMELTVQISLFELSMQQVCC